jgi:geranylgeranyl diphosphate synthase type II
MNKSLNTLLADIEAFVNEQIINAHPANLYEPVNHIMRMPAKRIRPLLTILAGDLYGGKREELFHIAYAVEMFHNFTLVHDDIMDEAEIRRGQPAVHIKYGLNSGILSGDVMFFIAMQHLMHDKSNPALPDIVRLFTRTGVEIIEGQQMDMDFENRSSVGEEEYLTMIRYKTSVLLAAALSLGAMASGAPQADRESLYHFGISLGLSFQIKDDYLDAFGDSSKVGKKKGGDILRNKKTFLMIQVMNQPEFAPELSGIMSTVNPDEKVEKMLDLYERSGAKASTLQKAENLYNEALGYLKALSVSEEKSALLKALAEMVHNREF